MSNDLQVSILMHTTQNMGDHGRDVLNGAAKIAREGGARHV